MRYQLDLDADSGLNIKTFLLMLRNLFVYIVPCQNWFCWNWFTPTVNLENGSSLRSTWGICRKIPLANWSILDPRNYFSITYVLMLCMQQCAVINGPVAPPHQIDQARSAEGIKTNKSQQRNCGEAGREGAACLPFLDSYWQMTQRSANSSITPPPSSIFIFSHKSFLLSLPVSSKSCTLPRER